MAPTAPDFQKMISDARERKKNENLADKIFSRDRRQDAASRFKSTMGGSLASRVGVKKHGAWTHDLHISVNGGSRKSGSANARITASGINKPTRASTNRFKRNAKLAAALDKTDADQSNIVAPSAARSAASMGMTIRGLAGLYAVMGQNFAPGTTAADIESAMTPVGGEMLSCRIIKTSPFLLAEMVFSSREGGERVIETFNNKIADGRVIKLYPKIGGYKAPIPSAQNEPPANAPTGPKGTSTATRDQFVDGSMGFPDLVNDPGAQTPSAASPRLYSDNIARGNRGGSTRFQNLERKGRFG
ncbi:hypothetical protein E4U42_006249 [Claviceps africana]|uniref:RRM domain-containing protein n=1 Tax=Claviceps africana TaxID=83212 RepID=A0A8K0NFV0_9HYPO|nr:hypothetical protein E4U42_006249 [Claviceps africana]